VLDTADGAVELSIPLDPAAGEISNVTVDGQDTRAYVTHEDSPTLSVVDITSP
jgi:hypothetical protein